MNASEGSSGHLADLPVEVLHGLLSKWVESFENAARAENRQGIMNLFSEQALIAGSHKGGPLDSILSKGFSFHLCSAKIYTQNGFALALVPWTSNSIIANGNVVGGEATLFVGAEQMEDDRKRFVCYHAHFSQC